MPRGSDRLPDLASHRQKKVETSFSCSARVLRSPNTVICPISKETFLYNLASDRWITMPSDNLRTRLKSRIQNSQFLNYIYRALRSFAYPLQGIYYFFLHREFWPLWAGRLLPLSIISLIVYLILFLFAYLPQVAVLAIWQGRGAWFSGLILTLGEGQVLIQTLFEGFFVDETRVDVFDVRPVRIRPVFPPRC